MRYVFIFALSAVINSAAFAQEPASTLAELPSPLISPPDLANSGLEIDPGSYSPVGIYIGGAVGLGVGVVGAIFLRGIECIDQPRATCQRTSLALLGFGILTTTAIGALAGALVTVIIENI